MLGDSQAGSHDLSHTLKRAEYQFNLQTRTRTIRSGPGDPQVQTDADNLLNGQTIPLRLSVQPAAQHSDELRPDLSTFCSLLLVTLAQLLGGLCVKLRQPKVVGEILAGVVLGPALVGRIPRATWIAETVTHQANLLNFVYWLGLLLLMFLSGAETQKLVTRENAGIATESPAVSDNLAAWTDPRRVARRVRAAAFRPSG